jgi:hypothetical protein
VGGLGRWWGPWLEVGVTWRSWLGAVWGAGPTTSSTVRAGSHPWTAATDSDLAGVELARLARIGPRLQPSLGLSAGAYHLRAEGRDVSPLGPLLTTAWTPFLAAGAGLAVTVSAHLAVRLDARALVLRDAPQVLVGPLPAGHVGRPALFLAAAVSYQP